jgi:hypothetical protein
MPLFQIALNNQVKRYRASGFDLERQLQSLIEHNLDEIFGVRFIATEFIIVANNPDALIPWGWILKVPPPS